MDKQKYWASPFLQVIDCIGDVAGVVEDSLHGIYVNFPKARMKLT